MTKHYPATSSLTIGQRLEQLAARRRKDAKDVYVSVHDNGDGDGFTFGFYLNDYDSPFENFKSYKEMDYRLDTENRTPTVLSLGFNFSRLKAS